MVSEKKKRNNTMRVKCPDCDKPLPNAGTLTVHKRYCKGAAGAAKEGKPADSKGPTPRPSQPSANPWGPLGDL